MSFDWLAFLESEGISYADSGKNVKKGNVNIHCILCGADDPAKHMGLNLATGAWGCWRDATHRGKDPARLVQILKGCDRKAAEAITRDELLGPSLSLADMRKRLAGLDHKQRQAPLQRIERPTSFRPILEGGRTTGRFWDYLVGRGFPAKHLAKLCRTYDLSGCNAGKFKGRLILPFWHKGKLIGWTARALSKHAEIRYYSWPDGDTVKRTLYNFDNASKGGRTLVIVEGPLDCLKVDFYGRRYGVRAVALLGVSATPAQLSLLFKLSDAFDRVVVLLDAAAGGPASYLCSQLMLVGARVERFKGAKDPGELLPKQARRLARTLSA